MSMPQICDAYFPDGIGGRRKGGAVMKQTGFVFAVIQAK